MRAERSILERAGLASGLLTEEQIDRAWHVLVESLPLVNQGLDEISDEQLSAQMIALGYLNRWQAEQLRLGRTKFTLGAYRILDAIGHGGMGWVFKCEHVLLGRIEAIKVLPKSKSNPASIASFLQEIRAQARVTHPHLVHLTYADTEGDTYFLVTEYVPGTDLRKMVRYHGPLSMNEAAVIVSQTAEALAYAHRAGLVHRDVKPGNLLITPEGNTKLADLGLASFHTEQQTQIGKKPRHIVGTADYVAPEIIVSPEKLQTVSDIYSLGCTLYYAVTGKVPFPGGDTSDKLRRHLEEPPLSPQKLSPSVSDDFARVIAALMEKRPADRVSSAEEVVVLLRPWVVGSDVMARQHIGSLTKLSGNLDHQSNLADTLPVVFETSETQDVQQDTTDAGSLAGVSLPKIVVTDRPLITPSSENHGKHTSQGWPLNKIIAALFAAAVLTLGTAIYLLSQ